MSKYAFGGMTSPSSMFSEMMRRANEQIQQASGGGSAPSPAPAPSSASSGSLSLPTTVAWYKKPLVLALIGGGSLVVFALILRKLMKKKPAATAGLGRLRRRSKWSRR